MNLPDPLPERYFQDKGDKSIKIKPYNKKYKKIAKSYLNKINKILKPFKLKAMHRGATALEISGKGDIEFCVYPKEKQWEKVLIILINNFKGIKELNNGFAQFVDKYRGEHVEVICIKEGFYATLDKKLFIYLKKHPKIIKEYEEIKNRFSYSAKEYSKAKDKFLRKIIETIPE